MRVATDHFVEHGFAGATIDAIAAAAEMGKQAVYTRSPTRNGCSTPSSSGLRKTAIFHALPATISNR